MTLPSHKLSLNVDTEDKLFPTGLWKGLVQERRTADTSNSHLGQHQPLWVYPHPAGVKREGGVGGGVFLHLGGGGG